MAAIDWKWQNLKKYNVVLFYKYKIKPICVQSYGRWEGNLFSNLSISLKSVMPRSPSHSSAHVGAGQYDRLEGNLLNFQQ